MKILADIDAALTPYGLFIMGHSSEHIIIGAGRGFWPIFKTAPEYNDHQADPIDRWSKRILLPLAARFGAMAHFPSDGPPYQPFIQWAYETGRFFQSPTGMMVHDVAGMMVSIRGAFSLRLEAPDLFNKSPCDTCLDKPCVTACPVSALGIDIDYDVPKCKAHLETEHNTCRDLGCLVRRACPISQKFNRDPEQSAFHMKAFMNP